MVASWLDRRSLAIRRKSKSGQHGKKPKNYLRLPDLEHAKAAVLSSLSNVDAQRGYSHAIDEFVDWYCSEVDEVTLALLWLTHFKDGGAVRAWKGHDFGTMDRLHERDYISDPKGKAKSVALTEEGEKRPKELFLKYFKPKT